MSVFRYHFNHPRFLFFYQLSLIGLFALFFTGCEDIPRDNPLDPRNPNSIREHKVLVEAFVNTSNPFNYNEVALEALDSLVSYNSEQMIIVEYHRNSRDYSDPYHLPENDALYQSYLSIYGGISGMPDVFFDVQGARVQGASTVANSFRRFSNALSGLLNQNSEYALEIHYEKNGNLIRPKITLAKLGTTDGQDLQIRAILIAQIDNSFLKRVVRDYSSLTVATLPHGRYDSFNLPGLTIREPQQPHALVAVVSDRSGLVIYQSEIQLIQ
ncbi:MAG: hypothetical protein D6748_10645 [Calditrichaeota bacterium]|nr:MAG: hypothetical protein D6748_10645 [Calditrichota bacterium]